MEDFPWTLSGVTRVHYQLVHAAWPLHHRTLGSSAFSCFLQPPFLQPHSHFCFALFLYPPSFNPLCCVPLIRNVSHLPFVPHHSYVICIYVAAHLYSFPLNTVVIVTWLKRGTSPV